MSSVAHPLPSYMTQNVAARFGHSDDTLVAWQQACVQAAETLQPPPDPERLAKALALAQNGAVALDDDGAALVTSNGTRYHVEADGTCHCPDTQHRGVPCKHLLAVQIHQQATAQLAPSASAVPPRAATPQLAPTPDTHQGRLPSADRWDVNEAPASCCLRLRIGELELMYTMRDVSDAELTSRVQHLVPWVQDLLDQARERQTLLDTLRQQREAAHASPAAPAPSALQPPTPPVDLQALLQQAVQQALAAHAPSHGTPPANGQAPSTPPPAPPSTGTAAANGATPFCPLHQVAIEQRSNARGSWWSHWLADEKRYCKGKQPCNGAEDGSPPPQPEEETTMLRMDHYPYSRFWAIWDDQDLVAVVVYKKGAAELLRRLQAHAQPPTSAGAAAPAAPTAAARPGERQRAAQRSRRLAQG